VNNDNNKLSGTLLVNCSGLIQDTLPWTTVLMRSLVAFPASTLRG